MSNKKSPPQTQPPQQQPQPQAQQQTQNPTIEKLQGELAQMTETCKRTLADFANYKRLTEEQRKQASWFGIGEIIRDILPIIDNFERALSHMQNLDTAHREGIEAIHRQLLALLEKNNVKKIETIGKPFDPMLHEVLSQAPGETNIIIEEFEKGYTLGTQVLKPAKVVVGNG